jgi:predicted dehydrogenase
MKIGIVGPADRAIAWENHLRSHQSVSEVAISAQLDKIGSVDACFLLDDSENRLDHLLEAIKAGYHTFLIAPLPTHSAHVEKVYHAAEESNVLVQFSHWPTLAPASKWMARQIRRPSFIQIVHEISHSEYLESNADFGSIWIDELAFCLRWMDGAVHHIDLKTVELSPAKTYIMHLFLRFDSGATSNIYVNVASAKSKHHRLAADHNYIIDCDVLEQSVRLGELNGNQHLFFKRHSFEAARSAELSAMEFIKSIQFNRPTIYNSYHLLELTKTLDKIKKRIVRFN